MTLQVLRISYEVLVCHFLKGLLSWEHPQSVFKKEVFRLDFFASSMLYVSETRNDQPMDLSSKAFSVLSIYVVLSEPVFDACRNLACGAGSLCHLPWGGGCKISDLMRVSISCCALILGRERWQSSEHSLSRSSLLFVKYGHRKIRCSMLFVS